MTAAAIERSSRYLTSPVLPSGSGVAVDAVVGAIVAVAVAALVPVGGGVDVAALVAVAAGVVVIDAVAVDVAAEPPAMVAGTVAVGESVALSDGPRQAARSAKLIHVVRRMVIARCPRDDRV
jgi:hypothetical protein